MRDADGMNVFAALDRDLGIGIGDGEAGPSNWERKLEERLREYAASAVHEDVDSESEEGGGGVDDSPMSVDSHVGDKRKLSVTIILLFHHSSAELLDSMNQVRFHRAGPSSKTEPCCATDDRGQGYGRIMVGCSTLR